MIVREHFLLATELATVTATAKTQCKRQDLFYIALESILTRYQEEFGEDACLKLRQDLARAVPKAANWRIRPEDSCWSQAQANLKAE